jgi:hypothetical protein
VILNHFSFLLYPLEKLHKPSQDGAEDVRLTVQEADICERNMEDIFKLYQINFGGRFLIRSSVLCSIQIKQAGCKPLVVNPRVGIYRTALCSMCMSFLPPPPSLPPLPPRPTPTLISTELIHVNMASKLTHIHILAVSITTEECHLCLATTP